MKVQELKIEGMSCGHCVMSVRKELDKLPHVTVEEVKIGSAKVQYDESAVSLNDLAKAVEHAGYRVVA